MPLNKLEVFERYPPISFRSWKNKESKTVTFLDDGRDVNTENGLAIVFSVKEDKEVTVKSLWIRPSGALHIGLNEYIPLKGKTVKVTKTIDKDKDPTKGTRYNAVLVKE